MEGRTAILATLVVYNAILVAIGLWANQRTHSETEFFLGGRRLGPWVASLSASASSSSAWTLLGVSGAAYLWGLPAIWLIPATVSGFVLNWLYVGPRLRRMSSNRNAITLTDFLAGPEDGRLQITIRNTAAFITLFSFAFYVAAQFQAAGQTFETTFQLQREISIIIGALIVLAYIMLGGFWAVSVTDVVQGLLMFVSAIILPISALTVVGGFSGIWHGLKAEGNPRLFMLTPETGILTGFAFVIGLLGIGLGYPGQPHVVNRFMAIKDEASMNRGKVIAIVWAITIYVGMVLLGLSGRVLMRSLADPEQVLFRVAETTLPPVMAGMMIAAVLSAIMSTVDSQLLVAASSVTHDSSLRMKNLNPSRQLLYSRLTVSAITLLAIWMALRVSEAIFSRVLFAWNALGSAFGPLVLVTLLGRPVRPAFTLPSMIVGFAGTVLLNTFPNAPGDIVERYVPFLAALIIAWFGRK